MRFPIIHPLNQTTTDWEETQTTDPQKKLAHWHGRTELVRRPDQTRPVRRPLANEMRMINTDHLEPRGYTYKAPGFSIHILSVINSSCGGGQQQSSRVSAFQFFQRFCYKSQTEWLARPSFCCLFPEAILLLSFRIHHHRHYNSYCSAASRSVWLQHQWVDEEEEAVVAATLKY